MTGVDLLPLIPWPAIAAAFGCAACTTLVVALLLRVEG